MGSWTPLNFSTFKISVSCSTWNQFNIDVILYYDTNRKPITLIDYYFNYLFLYSTKIQNSSSFPYDNTNNTLFTCKLADEHQPTACIAKSSQV